MQPTGDIRASVFPRDFRVLPIDVSEVINIYFHIQELEDWVEKDSGEDQDMSTDTEVAGMVRRLQMGDPAASVSLQEAICDMLVPATAPRPQEKEYYYNSDDSILDLDAVFPNIAEWVVEWQMAQRAAAFTPSWQLLNFGKTEQACYEREPDLMEVLNQMRQARAAANIPVQPVAPMSPLPQEVTIFASVRDLDRQCQQ